MELDHIKANKQALLEYEKVKETLRNQIVKLEEQFDLTKINLKKEKRKAIQNGRFLMGMIWQEFSATIVHNSLGKKYPLGDPMWKEPRTYYYLCINDYLEAKVVASEKSILTPTIDNAEWTFCLEDLNNKFHYFEFVAAFEEEAEAKKALEWLQAKMK
jgi:hypothetical protein